MLIHKAGHWCENSRGVEFRVLASTLSYDPRENAIISLNFQFFPHWHTGVEGFDFGWDRNAHGFVIKFRKEQNLKTQTREHSLLIINAFEVLFTSEISYFINVIRSMMRKYCVNVNWPICEEVFCLRRNTSCGKCCLLGCWNRIFWEVFWGDERHHVGGTTKFLHLFSLWWSLCTKRHVYNKGCGRNASWLHNIDPSPFLYKAPLISSQTYAAQNQDYVYSLSGTRVAMRDRCRSVG